MIDVDGTVRDSTTLVKSPGSTPSTTTTSSTTTTTSTSATSGGSTTTSTTRAADACGRRACDDGNRCTLDTCAPGGGCRHEPVDLAALRASIDSEFTVDACVGQPAPVLVTALLRQARGQVEQAAHATNLVRARRLLARALQSLQSPPWRYHRLHQVLVSWLFRLRLLLPVPGNIHVRGSSR